MWWELFGVRDARNLQLKSPARQYSLQTKTSEKAAVWSLIPAYRKPTISGTEGPRLVPRANIRVISYPPSKKKHIISIQTLSRWRAPIGPQPRLESVPSTEAMEAATPADAIRDDRRHQDEARLDHSDGDGDPMAAGVVTAQSV